MQRPIASRRIYFFELINKTLSIFRYAFDTFDKNDDGTIDFNEFLLSVAVTHQGDLDERLSVAFDLYDISDDGQIDQKELTKMLTAIVNNPKYFD